MTLKLECGVLSVWQQYMNRSFHRQLILKGRLENSHFFFFKNLSNEENEYRFFQQYRATAYTVNNSIAAMLDISGEWISSHLLWPAHSSNFISCAYYLQGYFIKILLKQHRCIPMLLSPSPQSIQTEDQTERGGRGRDRGEGGTTLDKLSGMQYQKFLGMNLKKQLLIYSPGIRYVWELWEVTSNTYCSIG